MTVDLHYLVNGRLLGQASLHEIHFNILIERALAKRLGNAPIESDSDDIAQNAV